MSDNLTNSNGANAGVTLPEGYNATHNSVLSPLFLNVSGRGSAFDSEIAVIYRGKNSYIWSSIVSYQPDSALRFTSDDTINSPNATWANYIPFSLRCLVSTNNR